MHILIVDDDIKFINQLKKDFINYFSPRHKEIIFRTISKDFNSINLDKIDIAFIDIDLKKHNGIDFAIILKKQFPHVLIIFISLREDLVFSALSVGIFQFIRKSKYKFDSLTTFNQLEQFITENLYKKAITIRGRKIIITVYNIQYILSIGHDVILHLNDREYILKGSLKEILNLLDAPFIIQIQRNLAINFYFITEFSRSKIKTIGNHEYVVGRKYQLNFIKKYEDFLLK